MVPPVEPVEVEPVEAELVEVDPEAPELALVPDAPSEAPEPVEPEELVALEVLLEAAVLVASALSSE